MKPSPKYRRAAALLLILTLLLSGCALVPLEKNHLPDPVPLVPEPISPIQEQASGFEEGMPVEDQEQRRGEGHSIVRSGEADPDPSAVTFYPEFPSDLHLLSGQAFVYDVDQGGVVAIRNRDERLAPASVTKLLTILTALQYLSPDQLVVPGEELSLVAWDSTLAYVNSGHIVSVETLIEGMLLPSGNDAAYVLAAAAGRKIAGEDPYCATSGGISAADAVELFVGEMNTFAQTLFMRDSHFVRPDGYSDENHYTTVTDMARLAIAAYDCELIRRYCGVLYDDVTYASGHTIRWKNTNEMLNPESVWYDPCVKGMKTGSLTGACALVTVLQKDGRTYLAAVFTAPDNESRYQDMTAIIKWLFK